LLNVGLLMRFECSFLMTPSLMIWSLADKTSWPGWHCLALLRLPRGTKSQAATRALIAESIRRCQRGRCKHNPLPLAHDAYTSVTCAACAGVHMVNTKSRKVLPGSDEPPARPPPKKGKR
jgi:hypothetical protein